MCVTVNGVSSHPCKILTLIREQSLKMLQTGVEEFKIFLCKISYPNIKCYFGFVPQQKNREKVSTPKTKRNV